jgi:hypothetical protein
MGFSLTKQWQADADIPQRISRLSDFLDGEGRVVASFVGTAEIGFIEAGAGFSNVRWLASIVVIVPSMNPAFPQKHW